MERNLKCKLRICDENKWGGFGEAWWCASSRCLPFPWHQLLLHKVKNCNNDEKWSQWRFDIKLVLADRFVEEIWAALSPEAKKLPPSTIYHSSQLHHVSSSPSPRTMIYKFWKSKKRIWASGTRAPNIKKWYLQVQCLHIESDTTLRKCRSRSCWLRLMSCRCSTRSLAILGGHCFGELDQERDPCLMEMGWLDFRMRELLSVDWCRGSSLTLFGLLRHSSSWMPCFLLLYLVYQSPSRLRHFSILRVASRFRLFCFLV